MKLAKLIPACLVTLLVSSAGAAESFVVFCAPGLNKQTKEKVFLEFQKFVAGGGGKPNEPHRGMRKGDSIQVFDGFTLKQIGPELIISDSARTAQLQFKEASQLVAAFNSFLKNETQPEVPLNIPRIVSTYKEKVNSHAARVLLIGSPIYFDDVPAHDMRKGWLSDGYFAQPSSVTAFSTADKGKSLRGNTFRFCTLLEDDGYGTDNKKSHQEMLRRFWAIYIERCGGKLVSFQSDSATGFQTLLKDDLEEISYQIDPSDAALSIHRSRTELTERTRESKPVAQAETVSLSEQTLQDSSSDLSWLFTSNPEKFNSERLSAAGKLDASKQKWVTRIGLVWTAEGDAADQDLDLYVRPRGSTDELCFKCTQTADGKHIKDFPSKSSAKYGFEIVDLTADIPPSDLQIWVNAFNGKCASGFTGEVRVLHRGSLKVYPIRMKATSGNKGAESQNRNRSKFWTSVLAE